MKFEYQKKTRIFSGFYKFFITQFKYIQEFYLEHHPEYQESNFQFYLTVSGIHQWVHIDCSAKGNHPLWSYCIADKSKLEL